jgi:hypothetical protein
MADLKEISVFSGKLIESPYLAIIIGFVSDNNE